MMDLGKLKNSMFVREWDSKKALNATNTPQLINYVIDRLEVAGGLSLVSKEERQRLIELLSDPEVPDQSDQAEAYYQRLHRG